MADFPEIQPGVLTQLPFEKTKAYRTTRNVMPCGLQYSYFHRNEPLRHFKLTFSSITQAEADILEEHFRGQHGRLIAFNFTDPDDTSVYRMRYDMDDLPLRHMGPDQISVEILLVQVPAP